MRALPRPPGVSANGPEERHPMPQQLPAQFWLRGYLHSITAFGSRTWIQLRPWQDPDQARQIDSSYPPQGDSGPFWPIMIEFGAADRAEDLADYRVGEVVRVAVKRRDWGIRAPQGISQQPPPWFRDFCEKLALVP